MSLCDVKMQKNRLKLQVSCSMKKLNQGLERKKTIVPKKWVFWLHPISNRIR
jgi:hypothetical protein